MSNLVKIAIASINTHVGNIDWNTERHIYWAKEIHKDRATIAAFPEQGFGGYPTEDLVQFKTFVTAQLKGFQTFVFETSQLDPVFVVGVTVPIGGNVFNCAASVYHGRVLGIVPKEKLPNYGIFWELRTFTYGIPGLYELIKPFSGSAIEHEIPFGDLVFKFPFGNLAIEVCEDIWSFKGPMSRRGFESDIVVNISASPFRGGVLRTRSEMTATRASDANVVLAYTNQVGGQDADVFDGGGFITQNGKPVVKGTRWKEGFTSAVVDLDETRRMRLENTTWRKDWIEYIGANQFRPRTIQVDDWDELVLNGLKLPPSASGNPFIPDRHEIVREDEDFFDEIIRAMQTALTGYMEKVTKLNGEKLFKRIGIALSGGKDSYLTLLVSWLYAKERFGDLPLDVQADKIRDFIHCFSMPTRFNSKTTKSIARMVCEELGVTFKEQSIQKAFRLEVAAQKEMLGVTTLPPLVEENIQPRIRAMRMWGFTTQLEALFLHTGNMSENAVGYTTVGGDIEGGYSLIGNLPKTVIIEMLKYLADKYPLESLKLLNATEASAELRPGQKDERDLMPFPILDKQLYMLVGQKKGPLAVYRSLRQDFTDDELKALAPWYKTGDLKEYVKYFYPRFFQMEFKRVRMPQAAHLGSVDLDRERSLHLPVAMSLNWLKEELALVEKEAS